MGEPEGGGEGERERNMARKKGGVQEGVWLPAPYSEVLRRNI